MIKTALLASALFLVTAPAVALDLTSVAPTANVEIAPAVCQTLDSDKVAAARYNWFPGEVLEGEKAQHWLKRYNNTPPQTDRKAVTIVAFKNTANPARVIVVFIDEKGCVVHREAIAVKVYEDYRDKD